MMRLLFIYLLLTVGLTLGTSCVDAPIRLDKSEHFRLADRRLGCQVLPGLVHSRADVSGVLRAGQQLLNASPRIPLHDLDVTAAAIQPLDPWATAAFRREEHLRATKLRGLPGKAELSSR